LTPDARERLGDVLVAPFVGLNLDRESTNGIALLRSLPPHVVAILLSRGVIMSERIQAEARRLIDEASGPRRLAARPIPARRRC
jgi:hypothetical protein